jgi:hypothetical protein
MPSIITCLKLEIVFIIATLLVVVYFPPASNFEFSVGIGIVGAPGCWDVLFWSVFYGFMLILTLENKLDVVFNIALPLTRGNDLFRSPIPPSFKFFLSSE